MEDKFFDPDSWIMVFLSRVGDLMIANLLWLVTSLPIITLGASTTALYTVVKNPGEKRYTSSIVKNYFKAFGQNFKKATLEFLIMLVLTVLVLADLYILVFGLMGDSAVRYVLCAVPVLLLLFAWSWIFPLTASFENSLWRTIGNAFTLAVAHLPTTIALTVLNLLPVLVLLFFTEFFYKGLMLWTLLGFALIAKVDSLLLERVFRKYIPVASREDA